MRTLNEDVVWSGIVSVILFIFHEKGGIPSFRPLKGKTRKIFIHDKLVVNGCTFHTLRSPIMFFRYVMISQSDPKEGHYA